MTLPPPFGQIAAKRPDAFRPCGFSPLRRFTPHTSLGSIAPRNRTGFAAFPNELPSNGRPKPTTDGSASLFPATRFTPLEEYPSSVAVPRHRGRCPPVVDTRSTPRHDRSVSTSVVPPRLPSFRSSTEVSVLPWSRVAFVQLKRLQGIRTGVVLPLVCPARSDPP